MRIEPARLHDLDRIVELWVALAAEQQAHGSHLTVEPNRAVMRETLAHHLVDHTCLVARREAERIPELSETVGFVSFNLERDGLDRDVQRGVVQNLYVVPTARSEGIGGALLSAADDALKGAGVERIVLETLAANDAARRFYEHHGYILHRVAYERPTESDTNSREES